MIEETVFRFNRRLIPPEVRNTSSWPAVDFTQLNDKRRARFKVRQNAMRDYFADVSVKEICKTHPISRTELKRLRKRCLATHPDGTIWGWRALIPHKRHKPYVRRAPVKICHPDVRGARSGALSQLFDCFPDIRAIVDDLFLKTKKQGVVHESRIPIASIHKRFLDACRTAGLTARNYPFSTKCLGRIALFNYLRLLLLTRPDEAVKARYGVNAARKLNAGGSGESGEIIMRPLRRVQFDGHRIDTLCAILLPHPFGGVVKRLLERLWLLTIMDVASRAILGYHLCLNREYNSYDVLRCVKNAVRPWAPRVLSIPGLKYPAAGGLPSGKIPELAWGLWDELSFDNAKANLSQLVRTKLTSVLGCAVNPGPRATPESRGIQERFFQTFEQHGFHRLPSTTGSGPQDSRRQKPEEAVLRWEILLDQILDLCDVIMAQYNGAPHASLGYRSPLEVLEFFVANKDNIIRTVPEEERDNLNLLNLKVRATVRGNLKTGTRPYVQFSNVRYQNEVLARSPALISTDIELSIEPDDPRTADAYMLDGSGLGSLTAHGIWGKRPHTLEIRKAAFSLRNKRDIYFTDNDDAIQIYLDHLAATDPKDRRASSRLAQVHESMTKAGPELPAVAPVVQPSISTGKKAKAKSKPKPTSMPSPKTFSY